MYYFYSQLLLFLSRNYEVKMLQNLKKSGNQFKSGSKKCLLNKVYFRRTVKATILLVPLLGISNIPLFYEPEEPGAIYMLGSAILQHSQVWCVIYFIYLIKFLRVFLLLFYIVS